MRKTLLHPVWIKKNAVQPRNQKNVLTSADRKRIYVTKADRQGETLNDIKSRLQMWKLQQELCSPRIK